MLWMPLGSPARRARLRVAKRAAELAPCTRTRRDAAFVSKRANRPSSHRLGDPAAASRRLSAELATFAQPGPRLVTRTAARFRVPRDSGSHLLREVNQRQTQAGNVAMRRSMSRPRTAHRS